MNIDIIIQPIYLISAILFILSLMWMNHPSTARRGVFAGVIAMLAAIGGTPASEHQSETPLSP